MLYFLINNKPKLIRSMLAAGIVQDTFAGEAEKAKEAKRNDWRLLLLLLLPLRLESLPFFLALEFHSQNTHTHMGIRNRRIHIRECGSTLYVGLARAVPPTNTNFRLTFLLTRLQELFMKT